MYKHMLLTAALALSAFAVQAAPAAPPPPTAAEQAKLQQEFEQLQKQMQVLGARMGELAEKMHANTPRVYAYRIMANPNRGMLGLVMMPGEKGLNVVGVTPGSAAEKAGIKAGDLIVAVDGKPVAKGKGERPMGALHDLKVGQKVKLKLENDGKVRRVQVTAQRGQAADWPNSMVRQFEWHDKNGENVERIIINARRKIDRMRAEHPMMFIRTPFWGLNLASLNKDLGSYFGTDKGALVLSGDSKRYPGLEAGDVITRVDGNNVDGPEDVMRALHEHKGKGEAKITVRRHNRMRSIMMKVPSLDALLPPMPPMPPEPPAPPKTAVPAMPPAPPAPPPPPPSAQGA